VNEYIKLEIKTKRNPSPTGAGPRAAMAHHGPAAVFCFRSGNSFCHEKALFPRGSCHDLQFAAQFRKTNKIGNELFMIGHRPITDP
jgi:hypothetical protein